MRSSANRLNPNHSWFAGIDKPYGMHGRIFLGNQVGPVNHVFRRTADETVNSVRSVRVKNIITSAITTPTTFYFLNRYEKCFPIKPLMRKLMAEGKLSGPPADLMSPNVVPEQLFDTEEADPHEIKNLANSKKPSTAGHCLPCVPLWIPGLWRRRIAGNFLSPMRSWLLLTRKCTIGLVPRTGIKRNNYLSLSQA